jgi:CDP-glucose 4,6-dehydratase
MINSSFWNKKRVFITGHTGFKGSWLCQILKNAGANVFGYALDPVDRGIFKTASIADGLNSRIADIRNSDELTKAFNEANPDIVFHLAAQPIVLESYERPAYTFGTNVMGTVNLLECIRKSENVRSVVIVTTDKVYKNTECSRGYCEADELGGNDPYAASKACVEIVAESYRLSFLHDISLSTVRAGNVIGGGDVSANRIIPDCVRAALRKEDIIVRNPYSVRPYQHVLEPLFAYLLIAARQYENPEPAGSYNIGPDESDCVATGKIAEIFCNTWGDGLSWKNVSAANKPHESNLLLLDCSKARSVFDWKPVWNVTQAIEKTIEWEKASNKTAITDNQIKKYIEELS